MAIDISTIKPGGRVSVTLTDGTKIIDSPVTESDYHLWIACGRIRLCATDGTRRPDPQAVIDAYTPPAPAWFTPATFAVIDKNGVEWHQQGGEHPNGLFASRHYSSVSPSDVERHYGPCIILATYAEGVSQ